MPEMIDKAIKCRNRPMETKKHDTKERLHKVGAFGVFLDDQNYKEYLDGENHKKAMRKKYNL